MNEINALDIKMFITNSVTSVFDTMVSMEIEPSESDQSETLKGNHIVGTVGFAGKAMGCICIQVTSDFAQLITASMLGMDLDEIEGEEEVEDVIGELSNMIGGDLKSRLCDSGFPCDLSIPSITSGSDFKIESKGWIRHDRFSFDHQGHCALVEVFLKAGS